MIIKIGLKVLNSFLCLKKTKKINTIDYEPALLASRASALTTKTCVLHHFAQFARGLNPVALKLLYFLKVLLLLSVNLHLKNIIMIFEHKYRLSGIIIAKSVTFYLNIGKFLNENRKIIIYEAKAIQKLRPNLKKLSLNSLWNTEVRKSNSQFLY